jgi:rod shape-determining protein MreD
MPVVRPVVFALLLLAALVLQVTFFGYFSYDGVVPNLVLLVVVAAGLTRGPEVAAVLGFVGGMAIDLVPPADHVAGRWALALVVVGYLAGLVRHRDAGRSSLVALGTVAAASFVGTSLFALSGMLLRNPATPVAEALRVIPAALVYDLLLAPFVLPPMMRLFRRTRPHQVAYS